MGQKIHPTGFRLPVTRNWTSRWYASNKNFATMLASHKVNTSFHEVEGRHQYAVWRELFSEVAQVVFKDEK